MTRKEESSMDEERADGPGWRSATAPLRPLGVACILYGNTIPAPA
jgi:hypothetical protein